MADYQKLYHITFNAITDALREQEQLNFGKAREILQQAQLRAEDAYLDDSEDKTKE